MAVRGATSQGFAASRRRCMRHSSCGWLGQWQRACLVQREHVPTRFRHRGALQPRPPGGRPARHLATATDRVTTRTSHRHGLVCNVNITGPKNAFSRIHCTIRTCKSQIRRTRMPGGCVQHPQGQVTIMMP